MRDKTLCVITDMGIRENLSEEVTNVKKYSVGKRATYTRKKM